MNKLIKELAEQSGINIYPISITGSTEDFEKFAQLVVRECAELATKEYDNHGAIHGNDLLEHFGVK
jgi:hypothetical protein